MKKLRVVINTLWIFSVILSLGLIFAHELRPNLISFGLVYVFVTCSLVLSFFLSKNSFLRIKKSFIKLLILLAVLLVIHTLLNIFNIYDLVKSPRIIEICLTYDAICTISSTYFYKLKLFRFITLSPDFFISLVYLIVGFIFIRPTFIKVKPSTLIKMPTINKIFILILGAHLVLNSLDFISEAYKNLTSSLSAAKHPYDDRYIYKMGGNLSMGWIYTYSKFLRENIPANATIAIPPQTESWRMEGNLWYMRFFLYPRALIAAESIEATPNDKAEYVLISHGAWIGEKDHVWPKVTIPADQIEKIIHIDREHLNTEIMAKDYIPNYQDETWGFIELKK